MKTKLYCIIIIILMSALCVNIKSQTCMKGRGDAELTLLNVTDSFFIKAMDSLVLKGRFALEVEQQLSDSARGTFFFTLRIDQDPEIDYMYLISLYLYPGDIVFGKNNLGIFYIGEVPFIVERGCNPTDIFMSKKLFEETEIRKRFDFYINKCIMPQEFLFWFFIHIARETYEIVLSEDHIKRLGFIQCE